MKMEREKEGGSGDAIAEWLARSLHNQNGGGSSPAVGSSVDRSIEEFHFGGLGRSVGRSIAGWESEHRLGSDLPTFDCAANSQISISASLNNKT